MTTSLASASSNPLVIAIWRAAASAWTSSAEDVASARKGGRVGRVLLVASLHQHHPNVEGQSRDDEQREERPGEEDENLPSFGISAAS